MEATFLGVEDVAALQATADRLSGEIIQKRLNYWTVLLGPGSCASPIPWRRRH